MESSDCDPRPLLALSGIKAAPSALYELAPDQLQQLFPGAVEASGCAFIDDNSRCALNGTPLVLRRGPQSTLCPGFRHAIYGEPTIAHETLLHALCDVEGLQPTLECAERWIESYPRPPRLDSAESVLVLAPFAPEVARVAHVRSVSFWVTAEQLTLLVACASYGEPHADVRIGAWSNCMSMLSMTQAEEPRAVVGLLDPTKRSQLADRSLLALHCNTPMLRRLCDAAKDGRCLLHKPFCTQLLEQLWDCESAVGNASTIERLTFAHIDYWVPRPSLLSRAWSALRRVAVAQPKQILSDVSGTNKVGQAYKDTTFIFVVSSYVMILQYLVNVPEYFDERRILLKETENGTCTLRAYFASVFLRETPRAFFQVAVVTLLGYSAVGLNPEFRQMMYFFVVLVMGTFAWRSCVTFFSFVTDSIGIVYSLLFLNLGVGALLGGFLLTRNNIPPFLRWGYYASIPSFTQRSLVLTDLWCCHLEESCEDLRDMVASFVSTKTSSIVTTFNCTASAKLNLGPFFIDLLKINDDFFPWNVLVLVVAFVLFHVCALLAQHTRIRLSRSLSHKQHAQ
eukprot:m51a1_g6137 hypothetical protein (567) ;mRNA; r:250965-257139